MSLSLVYLFVCPESRVNFICLFCLIVSDLGPGRVSIAQVSMVLRLVRLADNYGSIREC